MTFNFNPIKLYKQSRKNGLLESNFNFYLIASSLVVLVAIFVVLALNVRPIEPAPALRYTSAGQTYYDRGAWYRPVIILLFGGVATGMNVFLAATLLRQKWFNVASSVLIINVFIVVTSFIITLGLMANYNLD